MITAASATLLQLLRDELGNAVPNQRITLESPGARQGGAGGSLIGLFLYAVAESPYLKNEPPTIQDAITRRQPPLTLDLYYLLTAYPSENQGDPSAGQLLAHANLALAMRTLYDNGVLAGSRLRSDLSGTDAELRLSLNPITVEDMTRLWEVFPEKLYQPSVGYLLTPVPVESQRTIGPESRVVEDTRVTGQLAGAGSTGA